MSRSCSVFCLNVGFDPLWAKRRRLSSFEQGLELDQFLGLATADFAGHERLQQLHEPVEAQLAGAGHSGGCWALGLKRKLRLPIHRAFRNGLEAKAAILF